ncbi:MAG TPA: hypothetical protein VK579_00065, partial [Terriglobales bacterium]|nr:hypothetical protein [Terriglobales bacterium]
GPMLDRLIRSAIRRRRLLQYRYRDKNRIVEPHDYGIQGGSIKLFTYQVRGSSSEPLPNWRMMFVAGISDAHIMNESFSGGHPVPSGEHHKWEKVFARVKPASAKSNESAPKIPIA